MPFVRAMDPEFDAVNRFRRLPRFLIGDGECALSESCKRLGTRGESGFDSHSNSSLLSSSFKSYIAEDLFAMSVSSSPDSSLKSFIYLSFCMPLVRL